MLFSDYWVDVILTQALIVGIAAASLIFLSAYGGMVSLAQTMLMGTSGFMLGNMVTKGGTGGETKGLTLGWNPTLSLVLAIAGTTMFGLLFGALAARSTGIYFLMITLTYLGGRLLLRRPGHGRLGLLGDRSINRYTPRSVGDIVHDRNASTTSLSACDGRLHRDPVPDPDAVRPRAARGPRRAGADELARLRRAVHRTLAFGFSAFLASLAGVLLVWWQGQISPGDIGLQATIDL